MGTFTESFVEDAALDWLDSLGYAVLHGPDIAAGMPGAERGDPNYRDVVMERNLRCTNVQGKRSSPLESMDEIQRPARA